MRNVAHATRRDAIEFMESASQAPLTVEAKSFAFQAAGEALRQLKHSQLKGAVVLAVPPGLLERRLV